MSLLAPIPFAPLAAIFHSALLERRGRHAFCDGCRAAFFARVLPFAIAIAIARAAAREGGVNVLESRVDVTPVAFP